MSFREEKIEASEDLIKAYRVSLLFTGFVLYATIPPLYSVFRNTGLFLLTSLWLKPSHKVLTEFSLRHWYLL